MDEQHRALRTRGEDFLRKFLGIAEGSRTLIEMLHSVLAPNARIHLQNGDVVTPDISERQAKAAELVFPDLEVEFEETLFPDDRIVVRVRMTGTSSGRAPFVPKGGSFDVGGAFIARVTPELEAAELWPYLNPGFAFAFPPRGVRRPPPPRDAATEAEWGGGSDHDFEPLHQIGLGVTPSGQNSAKSGVSMLHQTMLHKS